MTATAGLKSEGDHWVIRGALDFQTVPALWDQLQPLLAKSETTLSLAGVDVSNSAALVFLLEAVGEAERQGAQLILRDLPASVYDIARMYNASDLLPARDGQPT